MIGTMQIETEAYAPRLVPLVREGAIRLNLGCGKHRIEGWVNIDRADGMEAYPLPQYADNSVDDIRASHILEHFGYEDTINVLREWHRVLRPGGRIHVSVPDFDKIVHMYETGSDMNAESYLFGGHKSKDDHHGAYFNETKVRQLLMVAGFVKVKPWVSDIADTAQHPVSLNLMGIKVDPASMNMNGTLAVCSVPRLGFNSHSICVANTIRNTGCQLIQCGGAWWHHGMDRLFEKAIENKSEYVLALDYDTVFQSDDVILLHDLLRRRPDIDAVAPLQLRRHDSAMLAGIVDSDHVDTPDGIAVQRSTMLEHDSIRVRTAHFGLTLFRVAAIASVPRPWFHEVPSQTTGGWEQSPTKIDADIWFWKAFEKAGRKLHLSTRVAVGHIEELATWPDVNGEPIQQLLHDFEQDGPPEGVWR